MRTPFEIEVIATELRARPLVVIDGGAAGGPADYWWEPSGLVKVFGFEPDLANYRALPKNEHWAYRKMALSNRDGKATFHSYGTVGSLERRRSYEAHGLAFTAAEVDVRRLASLRSEGLVPSLEVIKTDVEEHDIAVLEGAGEYLGEETLCVTSEFTFMQRISGSNFGRMDALLTSNGLLLFGISSGRGALGELSGGDVLYLRDIGSILASPAPAPVKRQRILKLFVLACLFRLPRYAYSLARMGGESGVLSRDEASSLRQAVLRDLFLPALQRSRWAARISAGLAALAQIAAGPAWSAKSGPGNNRLRASRWLFAAARLLPRTWSRRYEASLERLYQRYREQCGVFYEPIDRAE